MRKPRYLLQVLLVMFGVLLIIGFLLRTSINSILQTRVYPSVLSWAAQHGFVATRIISFKQHDNHSLFLPLCNALLRAPLVWWQANSSALLHVRLDIKFKNYQKLMAKRQVAIAAGLLAADETDYVPARLQVGLQSLPVRVRLKGDMQDHFATEKWSLRVKMRGSHALLGMRRFSLQSPITRDCVGPLLFAKTLAVLAENIITPRYIFVNYTRNGDDLGIMVLEEHFANELLAREQRTQSVIIKFREENLWRFTKSGFIHNPVFNNYLNSTIGLFAESQLAKSRVVLRQYRLAVGLLRGFIAGKLTASQVFDVPQIATYLAALDLWGSEHGLTWNNLRFYFNPISAKLEPIQYDVELNHRMPVGVVMSRATSDYASFISEKLLQDPTVKHAYQQAVLHYAEKINTGELQRALQQVEHQALQQIGGEFYLYRKFNVSLLVKQIACMLPAGDCRQDRLHYSLPSDSAIAGVKQVMNEMAVNAYLINKAPHAVLEVQNLLPLDVKLLAISMITKTGKRLSINTENTLKNTILAGTPFGTLAKSYELPLPLAIVDLKQVDVQVQALVPPALQEALGQATVVTQQAIPYYAALAQAPIPNADLKQILLQNKFLQLRAAEKLIIVPSGTWQVTGDLIVPVGYRLQIMKGVTLLFEAQHSLIAYGAVDITGSAAKPTILSGSNDTSYWNGIAILHAPQTSHWQHVIIRNTRGVQHGDWHLTGAVTFYRSDLQCDYCEFAGNRSEDALNIIHARYTLNHTNIHHAISDGLDTDFSQGTISHSQFTHIGDVSGGDAIDISGSDLLVNDTVISHVQDKGISVGEHSQANINSVTITAAGVGIASKDSSMVKLEQAALNDIRYYGLLAYIKKPIFGGAKIVANHTTIQAHRQAALAQVDSVISLNGEEITPVALDVKELYQSIMKSDKPL